MRYIIPAVLAFVLAAPFAHAGEGKAKKRQLRPSKAPVAKQLTDGSGRNVKNGQPMGWSTSGDADDRPARGLKIPVKGQTKAQGLKIADKKDAPRGAIDEASLEGVKGRKAAPKGVVVGNNFEEGSGAQKTRGPKGVFDEDIVRRTPSRFGGNFAPRGFALPDMRGAQPTAPQSSDSDATPMAASGGKGKPKVKVGIRDGALEISVTGPKGNGIKARVKVSIGMVNGNNDSSNNDDNDNDDEQDDENNDDDSSNNPAGGENPAENGGNTKNTNNS